MTPRMLVPFLLVALALPLGCVSNTIILEEDDASSTSADSTSTSASSVSVSASASASVSVSASASASVSVSASASDDETSLDTSASATTDEPPGPFHFATNDLQDYVQVDRVGFPGVNTILNLLGDKDAYNAATPQDDAALFFATNIFESLETLHLGAPGLQAPDNTGLRDDLLAFGLAPCVAPPLPMDSCDNQAAPLAIPDVLVVELDGPPSYRNGRRLDTPIMDVILALVLLDLDTHELTTFLDLDADGVFGPSLNPLTNDVAFPPQWPYLAPPHP